MAIVLIQPSHINLIVKVPDIIKIALSFIALKLLHHKIISLLPVSCQQWISASFYSICHFLTANPSIAAFEVHRWRSTSVIITPSPFQRLSRTAAEPFPTSPISSYKTAYFSSPFITISKHDESHLPMNSLTAIFVYPNLDFVTESFTVNSSIGACHFFMRSIKSMKHQYQGDLPGRLECLPFFGEKDLWA